MNTIAWLVGKTEVRKPIEFRSRITIIDSEVVTGHDGEKFTQYTFKYKGKVYVCNSRGNVYHLGHGLRPVMTNMRVEMTAKYRREKYIEGLCKLACDPTSETYWSM